MIGFFGVLSFTKIFHKENFIYTAYAEKVVTVDYPKNPDGTYSDAGETIYPVRLDLKLVDIKTKIIGSSVIGESSTTSGKYTMVETVFTARARALGGDLYLPAYREDVVSQAVITLPKEGSNAVVPGISTIKILRNLPKAKGKYLLHEYEEATIRIKVVYKVLPKAMPSRLVFATKLNTILWYPAVYENDQNDPGFDPSTGERMVQIPLINAMYTPQQVTRIDWQSEPVVLFKDSKALSFLKNTIKETSFTGINNLHLSDMARMANVLGALKEVFRK